MKFRCCIQSPLVSLVFIIFGSLVSASDESQTTKIQDQLRQHHHHLSRKLLLNNETGLKFSFCGTRSTTNEEKEEFKRVTKNWVRSNSNRPLSTVYITTYFHVISDGDRCRVTTNQIARNLEKLNNDFLPYNFQFVQGSNSPAFYDNSAWFNSNSDSTADLEMKSTLRRGGAHTMNVYVNAAILGGTEVGGYATLAQDYCHWSDQEGINTDGIVLNYKSLPGGLWRETGSTLTHEVGHWLNLQHTFENGCNEPGDGIDDTPYHERISGDWTCPLTRDTCSGDGLNDPVNNFMNYVADSCRSEFTTGQAEAMMAGWDTYRLNCDCGCDGGSDDENIDEEGFENEEDDVCASVTTSSSCFSPSTTLIVEGKGEVTMKDVAIGDKVLVSNVANTATDNYQEVYAFGHTNVYAKANFLQITTSNSNQESPLEITGEHLLMKQKSDAEVVTVRANSIEVGDYLIGRMGQAELVTQVSFVARRGLYAPLTKDGKIIVSGLQVSSYTAAQDRNPERFVVGGIDVISHHFMSHAASAPFRSMCNIMGGMTELCEQRNEEGQLLFAASADKLVHWIMEQATVVQIVVMPVLLFFMVAFHMLEKTSGIFVLTTCFFPLVWFLGRKFICVSFGDGKCGKGKF